MIYEQFSKTDWRYTLVALGFDSAQYIQSKQISKSVYFVQYKFNGRVCQTFVSIKTLRNAQMQKTIDASRTVQFVQASLTEALTSTNHVCTLRFCDCEAQKHGKAFLPKIEGLPVCKHNVAYARTYHGVTSLNKYIELIAG